MSMKILLKMKKAEERRQELLSCLFETKEMVRGTFCEIYVKCGKDNCWCKEGKGHLHRRMSIRENGKSHQRAVPKDEHVWIENMTNSYREFRNMRRDVIKLEKQIKSLLDQYEEQIVKKSKRGKAYLKLTKS